MKESINLIIENAINHLKLLQDSLDQQNIQEVVNKILNTKGKVIISGIGKSGHIGRKIAATLSSLGTPSFFLDSNEANHGDLGVISKDDIAILISNSGETKEMFNLINFLKTVNVNIIAITSKANSTMAKNADIAIIYPLVKEGIKEVPLAPIVSPLLVLTIGDLIASELVLKKQFNSNNYKTLHPGGKIGELLNDH
jgi:arabinose-5-phosphate isomerase